MTFKPSLPTAEHRFPDPVKSPHYVMVRTVDGLNFNKLPDDGQVDESVIAYAFVNWGKWKVRCPWCPSAQLASWRDQRFFCTDCGNVAVQGAWIKVGWPSDSDLQGIEHVLSLRVPANRNWNPGEDLLGLVMENVTHGVSTLEVMKP